jgi:hypothetical protein
LVGLRDRRTRTFAVAAGLWPGIVALHRGDIRPAGAPWFAISYLASVRRDGGPRLHPVCPIIAGGRLFSAIPQMSPKGWDLRRDPRCVIHALPGCADDELCIRALAHEVSDDATGALVHAVVARSNVGRMIESVHHDPLFEFDFKQVDVARWVNIGQPGPRRATTMAPPLSHRDRRQQIDLNRRDSVGRVLAGLYKRGEPAMVTVRAAHVEVLSLPPGSIGGVDDALERLDVYREAGVGLPFLMPPIGVHGARTVIKHFAR